jgi:hypothetical protein
MFFAVFVAFDMTSNHIKMARICGIDAITEKGDAFAETVNPRRPVLKRMATIHGLWDKDVRRARAWSDVARDLETWVTARCSRGKTVVLVVRSISFEGEILRKYLPVGVFRHAHIADMWFLLEKGRNTLGSGPLCAADLPSYDVATKVKAEFEGARERCLAETQTTLETRVVKSRREERCLFSLWCCPRSRKCGERDDTTDSHI